MPCARKRHICLIEGLKIGILELCVVEAEEVVHDDVASEGRECKSEVYRFIAVFSFLYALGKRVQMAVNNVYEVDDGAAGEPVEN